MNFDFFTNTYLSAGIAPPSGGGGGSSAPHEHLSIHSLNTDRVEMGPWRWVVDDEGNLCLMHNRDSKDTLAARWRMERE